MRPVVHFALWMLGLRAPETQTTAAERDALAAHAAGCQRIVEIGVWHGVTTRVLRRAMAADGLLWAVDPFPPGRLGFSMQYLIARAHLDRESNGGVRWVRAEGHAAAALYRMAGEPAPDLVFIDGDHAYEAVLADWRAWSALVKPKGVICLHDSRSTPERRIDDAGSAVVTRNVVLHDPRFTLLGIVDSLTIVSRSGEHVEA